MGILEGSRTRHASGAAGALPRAFQPRSCVWVDDAPSARGQVLASESARAYFVSVALPGAEPRSLRVHQAGRRLTVSGSRGRAGRADKGAARFAFAWDLPVRARASEPRMPHANPKLHTRGVPARRPGALDARCLARCCAAGSDRAPYTLHRRTSNRTVSRPTCTMGVG